MNNEEEHDWFILLKNKTILPDNKTIKCMMHDFEYVSLKKMFVFTRSIDLLNIKSLSSCFISVAIYDDNNHCLPLIQEKIVIKSIINAPYKTIEVLLCWNSTINQNEHIRIEIMLLKNNDNHYKRLLNHYTDSILLLSPKIVLQYLPISINLYKFEEEESCLISPNTNLRRTMENILNTEDHSYYFCIKYHQHSIQTRRLFCNEIKCIIHCNLPMINDSNENLILELYKDNLYYSHKQFNISQIIKGDYSSIQFISMLSDDYLWKSNVLLSIMKSNITEDQLLTKRILFQAHPMEMALYQDSKTKGRTHVWNITFTIHQINCVDIKESTIKISIGIQSQSISHKRLPINMSIQYQTISNNQSELPDIIIQLNYKSNTYISNLSSQRNSNNPNIVQLKSITHNDIKYSSITLKYSVSVGFKPISIPLMNNKNKKQNQTIDKNNNHYSSDSEIEDESNNDSSLTHKKSYHIIINCFYNEFNDNYPLPEKRGSLRIMINNQIQALNNISNQIYQTLLFKGIKFDIGDKSAWPIVYIEYYNNDTMRLSACSHDLHCLSYSIDQIEISDNKQWIELYDYYNINEVSQRLLCSIDIIGESEGLLFSSVKSMNILPITNQYNLEFISLGMRNMLNSDKAFFTIDLNSACIDNTSADTSLFQNSRLYKSNNDSIEIKDEITLPSSSSTKIEDIIGNVYQYNSITLINEFKGRFNIPVNEIILRSHREIDKTISFIQETFYDLNQDNLIDDINDKVNNNITGINDIKIEINNNNSNSNNNNQQNSLSHNNEKSPLIEINEKNYNYINIDMAKRNTILSNKINSRQMEIVILPQLSPYKLPGINESNTYYRLFERENVNSIPNVTQYKSIGELGHKHYRRYFNNPLENEEIIGLKSPFYNIAIDNIDRCYIKAIIRIFDKEKYSQYENVKKAIENRIGNISQEFSFLYQYDNLLKSISSISKVIIRIYITDIIPFSQTPENNTDIEIRIYLNNTLFHKRRDDLLSRYDIPNLLPGNCILKIELWEVNDCFGDELIGYTLIDIEDRYFDEKWKQIQEKPIETRPLIGNDRKINESKICLWIDIHLKDDIDQNSRVWEISNKNNHNNKFQMRIVAYQAELYDSIHSVTNERNDLFILLSNSNDNQYSDIHYNSNGYAYFNWRYVFNLECIDNNKINTSTSIITLKLIDYHLNNEELCIGTFDMRHLLDISYHLNIPLSFTKQLYDDLTEEKKPKEIIFSKDKSNQFWLNLFREVINYTF